VGSHWRYHIDQPVVLTLHRDQTSRLSRDFPSHFQRGILVYVFEKDNAALPEKDVGVRYADSDQGRFLIHHFSINIDARTIEKMNSPKMAT
jgi:hypothetical protein